MNFTNEMQVNHSNKLIEVIDEILVDNIIVKYVEDPEQFVKNLNAYKESIIEYDKQFNNFSKALVDHNNNIDQLHNSIEQMKIKYNITT